MKVQVLVGLALTLVLSVCPFVAETAAAARPADAHSCCPASRRSRRDHASVPAKGDCCLRAPAHVLVSGVQDPQATPGVPVEARADRAPERRATAVLADLSPPGDAGLVSGASPRAPPLPA